MAIDNSFVYSINITNDKLYWFTETYEEEMSFVLWEYNLEDQKINSSSNKVCTLNRFIGNSIINDCLISYEENDTGSIIYLEYLHSLYDTCIKFPSFIYTPSGNERCIVWENATYSGYNGEIYLNIYDQKMKTIEQLIIDNFYSYAIAGNYLVVKQSEMINCYDMDKKLYHTIINNDSLTMTEIKQGLLDNVYMTYNYEEWDYTKPAIFKVTNIKEKD